MRDGRLLGHGFELGHLAGDLPLLTPALLVLQEGLRRLVVNRGFDVYDVRHHLLIVVVLHHLEGMILRVAPRGDLNVLIIHILLFKL